MHVDIPALILVSRQRQRGRHLNLSVCSPCYWNPQCSCLISYGVGVQIPWHWAHLVLSVTLGTNSWTKERSLERIPNKQLSCTVATLIPWLQVIETTNDIKPHIYIYIYIYIYIIYIIYTIYMIYHICYIIYILYIKCALIYTYIHTYIHAVLFLHTHMCVCACMYIN
jgi:hypothetical protein